MQSFRSGISTRLTTKPGVSWQRIGVLPIRSPSVNAVSKGSSSVSSARTISTSGINGAGLKKCMPTTRSGVDVAAAISVTESADVFVASTASGRQTRSSSAKSRRFGSSSSTIASITTSQSAKSPSSVVSESRPIASSRAACSSWPFSVLRVRKWKIRSRAWSPSSAVTSRPTVSIPASTQSCAIPAPIAPKPTTPTLRTSTARDPTGVSVAAVVEPRVSAVVDGKQAHEQEQCDHENGHEHSMADLLH